MSSLFILNKNIDRAGGSGIPVYDNLEHIFSYANAEFNHTEGLITIPNDRLPAFQVEIPAIYDTVTEFFYKETRGANDFTGVTFTPLLSSIQKVRTFTKTVNGVSTDYSAWQVLNSTVLATPAPIGRFIIQFSFSDGMEGAVTYYTEEFTTSF